VPSRLLASPCCFSLRTVGVERPTASNVPR
jgi:hypothetical protein